MLTITIKIKNKKQLNFWFRVFDGVFRHQIHTCGMALAQDVYEIYSALHDIKEKFDAN